MFIGQPGSGVRGPFPTGSAVASPPPPAPPLLAAEEEAGAGPEVAAEPSALGAELTPLGSTPRSTPKPPPQPDLRRALGIHCACALRTRGSPSSVPSLGNGRKRFGAKKSRRNQETKHCWVNRTRRGSGVEGQGRAAERRGREGGQRLATERTGLPERGKRGAGRPARNGREKREESRGDYPCVKGRGQPTPSRAPGHLARGDNSYKLSGPAFSLLRSFAPAGNLRLVPFRTSAGPSPPEAIAV